MKIEWNDKKLMSKLQAQLQKTKKAGAGVIAEEMRKLVPVKTGETLKSITVVMDDDDYAALAGGGAIWIEYGIGPGSRTPVPFMSQAFQSKFPGIMDSMEDSI
jgi:hypothetical protein